MAWQRVWERIDADVRAHAYDDIGAVHVPVFRFPGPDGARPMELAERVPMSKRAMNHLLAYLEARGYVRREVDPLGGRSPIVRLRERGLAVLDTIVASIDARQREWGKAIGKQRRRELEEALRDISEIPAAATRMERARRAGEAHAAHLARTPG